MTFAKCLHLNRSVTPMRRSALEFVLPSSDRTPIYRRQVGSVFSVEYSGEPRMSYEDRGKEPCGVFQGCLF